MNTHLSQIVHLFLWHLARKSNARVQGKAKDFQEMLISHSNWVMNPGNRSKIALLSESIAVVPGSSWYFTLSVYRSATDTVGSVSVVLSHLSTVLLSDSPHYQINWKLHWLCWNLVHDWLIGVRISGALRVTFKSRLIFLYTTVHMSPQIYFTCRQHSPNVQTCKHLCRPAPNV